MPSSDPREFPKIKYLRELSDQQFDEMLTSGADLGGTSHEKTQEIGDVLLEAYETIGFLLLFLREEQEKLIPEIAEYWQKQGRLNLLVGAVATAEGVLDRLSEDFTAVSDAINGP